MYEVILKCQIASPKNHNKNKKLLFSCEAYVKVNSSNPFRKTKKLDAKEKEKREKPKRTLSVVRGCSEY